MENKNKKVVNKKNNVKGKGPNYYKGKNNKANTANKKKKQSVVSKKTNDEVVLSTNNVEELDKFRFYENTMAINLEGYIDVNDDIVEDYAEEPMLVDIKEDTLKTDVKTEELLEKKEILENNVSTINEVDSVNVVENIENVQETEIVDIPVEVVDGSDSLSENDNLIEYSDIVAPDNEIVANDDEFGDTEVLEIDEIKYSDNDQDTVIPEITEIVVENPVINESANNNLNESSENIVPVQSTTVENFVEDVSSTDGINDINNVSDDSTEKRYYNFETRIVFMVIAAIIAFVISIICIYQALNYTDIKSVVFNEQSTINYSVCYSDNNYYSGECLGEDMQYISTLANNVPITFNYAINYSDDVTYDIEYYVLGKTVIYDRDDASKILYRDDKILVERTTISGTDSFAKIVANVDVSFKERNDYVNGYKSKYALNSLASYEVVLYADDGNGPREVASATIPLSSQTFNITEETVLKENQQVDMQKVGLDSVNTIFGVVGALFLVIGIVVVFKLFSLVYKTFSGSLNAYEKKLNQILSEYDRVIVISRSEYNIDPNKQFIKVDSFYELLDARDTLEKPIIYEKVNSVKSFFYVEDNDKIYRYAMKESDFEKK